MFRRPVRSATPGGAFFILRSIHFLTALLNSIAAPRLTIPLLFLAIRHFAIPPPFSSKHFLRLSLRFSADLCVSLPWLRFALSCFSLPLLIGASRGFAATLRCCAIPLRCFAVLSHSVAKRSGAMPCHCFAERFVALPFQCSAMQYYTVASHLVAPHCRCVTLLRVAIPLRYWISSQVNRPFPLFRHWPMPEKRP